MSTLKGRNLISITDFTKEEYIQVLDIAEGFEQNPKQKILSDKVKSLVGELLYLLALLLTLFIKSSLTSLFLLNTALTL